MAVLFRIVVFAGFIAAKAQHIPNTKVLWPIPGAGELLAKNLEEDNQNLHIRVRNGKKNDGQCLTLSSSSPAKTNLIPPRPAHLNAIRTMNTFMVHEQCFTNYTQANEDLK